MQYMATIDHTNNEKNIGAYELRMDMHDTNTLQQKEPEFKSSRVFHTKKKIYTHTHTYPCPNGDRNLKLVISVCCN